MEVNGLKNIKNQSIVKDPKDFHKSNTANMAEKL